MRKSLLALTFALATTAQADQTLNCNLNNEAFVTLTINNDGMQFVDEVLDMTVDLQFEGSSEGVYYWGTTNPSNNNTFGVALYPETKKGKVRVVIGDKVDMFNLDCRGDNI